MTEAWHSRVMEKGTDPVMGSWSSTTI